MAIYPANQADAKALLNCRIVRVRGEVAFSDRFYEHRCVARDVKNTIIKEAAARTRKTAVSVRVVTVWTNVHPTLRSAQPARGITRSMTAIAQSGTRRGK